MKISARVLNRLASHSVCVTTAGRSQALTVQAKAEGRGSAVNGGELLMLALATCCCNDLYREAARLQIELDAVTVEAEADFEGVGLAATHIRYRARIESRSATPQQIEQLLRETDAVAEVHNTLRAGAQVSLQPWAD